MTGRQTNDKAVPTALTGEVLVVEDSLIIALEARKILSAAGAGRVHMASTVTQALEILEASEISLATLDVNLNTETSLRVAERCHALGIPFLLTTGYDSSQAMLADFPNAPVCVKPYTREHLTAAILKAQTGRV